MTATDLQFAFEVTANPKSGRARPDGANGPFASRWPWVVAAILTGLGLAVLLLGVARWDGGGGADGNHHYARTFALVEGIQNLAVLVIGTVLGVGAMRRTAAAVSAAARLRDEAARHQAAAQRAHDLARASRELAAVRARKLDRVQEVLNDVVAHAEYRACDNSRFVTNLQACDIPADPADPNKYRHLLVRSDTFSRVDPDLAHLADRARAMLAEIRRPGEVARPAGDH
jgi:hypothetical protein